MAVKSMTCVASHPAVFVCCSANARSIQKYIFDGISKHISELQDAESVRTSRLPVGSARSFKVMGLTKNSKSPRPACWRPSSPTPRQALASSQLPTEKTSTGLLSYPHEFASTCAMRAVMSLLVKIWRRAKKRPDLRQAATARHTFTTLAAASKVSILSHFLLTAGVSLLSTDASNYLSAPALVYDVSVFGDPVLDD